MATPARYTSTVPQTMSAPTAPFSVTDFYFAGVPVQVDGAIELPISFSFRPPQGVPLPSIPFNGFVSLTFTLLNGVAAFATSYAYGGEVPPTTLTTTLVVRVIRGGRVVGDYPIGSQTLMAT